MPISALSGPGETQFPVHLESVGLNRAIRESSLLAMVRTTAVQEISGSLTCIRR
jgi:hypothetical protein